MDYRGFKGSREPARAGSLINDPAGWHVEDISDSDERIDKCRTSEILKTGEAIRKIDRSDLELTTLKKYDFYLPQFSLGLREVREQLL